MRPRVASRFLSLVTALAMVANIVLAGCSQKTAQNASQSTPTPASGGLGGIFGRPPAASNPTSSPESGNVGGGDAGQNAAAAGADVTDIFKSGGAMTPRMAINNFVRRMRTLADNVPKADISVAGLADTLPNDANAVDQYVRDQIRLDIYPGAMRGALGAILSRAANPTDKASLLAALLQRKGMQVRFARGNLSDSEIATLQNLIMAPAPQLQQTVLSGDVVKELNVTDAAVTAARSRHAADTAQIAAGVTYGQAQADRLIATLSRRNIDVASTSAGEWPNALRQHYWVQVNQNGKWIDLDPCAPSIQPGQHMGTVDGSFSAGALPDDVYQSLTVKVIATFLRGGVLQDQALLTSTPKVVELVGQPVEISMMPDSDTKIENIGQAKTFQPVFSIGEKDSKGTVLDLQKDGAALAEVRFEIQASAPGRQTVSYRRWVLDRRSGSGLTSMSADVLARNVATIYRGLAATGSYNASFVAVRIADYLQAVKPALLDLIAPADQKSKNGLPLNANPYPAAALEYFVRDRAVADALEQAQNGSTRLYADRPNLAFARMSLANTTGSNTALSFDIMENGMAAAGANAHVSARLNVARGILDTRIEQIVMNQAGPMPTVLVMKAARQQGINPWILAPTDIAAAQKPALGQQTAESLQDTLRAGQAAVAVERPVALAGGTQFGWWAVDPKTGNTVGRMSGGFGPSMVEYAKVLIVINIAAHAILALVTCFGGGSGCACVIAVLELAVACVGGAVGWGTAGAAAGSIGEMGGTLGMMGSEEFGICSSAGGGEGGGEGGAGPNMSGGGPNMSGGGEPICSGSGP